MKISEIANRHIKICAASITVKNPENGKTCGVIRGICKFLDLHFNRQCEYRREIAPVWGCRIDGLINHVIIADGQLYYLHDLAAIARREKFFGGESWAREEIEKREQIAEKMEKFATVIPVYVE